MDSIELRNLGWNLAFEQQVSEEESATLLPVRVASHHGGSLVCLSVGGEFVLPVALTRACGEFW